MAVLPQHPAGCSGRRRCNFLAVNLLSESLGAQSSWQWWARPGAPLHVQWDCRLLQKSLCSSAMLGSAHSPPGAGVLSQCCSQGAFVCIIIPSSGIGLPYFASHKNNPEIRFDLFPATEIIVSCLLPCSSQSVAGAILKLFFQCFFVLMGSLRLLVNLDTPVKIPFFSHWQNILYSMLQH